MVSHSVPYPVSLRSGFSYECAQHMCDWGSRAVLGNPGFDGYVCDDDSQGEYLGVTVFT